MSQSAQMSRAQVQSPQLASLLAQIDESTGRARRMVATLSTEQSAKRPKSGGWSVGECVAHLTATTNEMLPGLRRALDEVRNKGLRSERRLRSGATGRMLARMLEPPYRMKFKTGVAFAPRAGSPYDVLRDFTASQARLLTLIEASEGWALDRVLIVSPANRRLRYNLYAAFRIIAAHQRRHLWQAEQVLKRLGLVVY